MTAKLTFILYQKPSNKNHNISAQLGMELQTFEKKLLGRENACM